MRKIKGVIMTDVVGSEVEFELEVPRRAPSARSFISNPCLGFVNFFDSLFVILWT